MTCPPFCSQCGGNLGHPANGDWVCEKCKIEDAIVRNELAELEYNVDADRYQKEIEL